MLIDSGLGELFWEEAALHVSAEDVHDIALGRPLIIAYMHKAWAMCQLHDYR